MSNLRTVPKIPVFHTTRMFPSDLPDLMSCHMVDVLGNTTQPKHCQCLGVIDANVKISDLCLLCYDFLLLFMCVCGTALHMVSPSERSMRLYTSLFDPKSFCCLLS